MKCKYCGAELKDGMKFCEECGKPVEAQEGAAKPAPAPEKPAPVPAAPEKPEKPDKPEKPEKPEKKKNEQPKKAEPAPLPPIQGQKVTENIYLCPDRVYRWVYEFPMLKNPTILFTVYKVLGLVLGVIWLFEVVLGLADGGIRSLMEFWEASRIFVYIAAGALVLGAVAYLIVAANYGWKYMVLFEMDDEQIKHIQMQKQFEKAKALGWLTTAAGLAAGNAAAAGAGILSAVRDTSVSEWRRVRRVKVNRRMHVIRVNQLLNRNQVYAEPADFDFVLRFIREHTDHAPAAK